MSKEIESSSSDGNEKRPPVPQDAVTSAASSMAARFLQESIDKGIPLKIPKLGIILYPDGREEKIKDQESP